MQPAATLWTKHYENTLGLGLKPRSGPTPALAAAEHRLTPANYYRKKLHFGWKKTTGCQNFSEEAFFEISSKTFEIQNFCKNRFLGLRSLWTFFIFGDHILAFFAIPKFYCSPNSGKDATIWLNGAQSTWVLVQGLSTSKVTKASPLLLVYQCVSYNSGLVL